MIATDIEESLQSINAEDARVLTTLLNGDGFGRREWVENKAVFERTERSLREGSWNRAGRINEALAGQCHDWLGKHQLLVRAIVMYNKATEFDACVRCHRLARQGLPQGLPPRQHMAAWRPAGLAIPYAHVGAATEALSEINQLAAQVTEWSLWEYYHLHLARAVIHRGLRSWVEVEREVRAFARWAIDLAEDAQELTRGNVAVDGTVDHGLWGDPGRWYCVCEFMTDMLIRARLAAGGDGQAELNEVLGYLREYESRMAAAQQALTDSPADRRLSTLADDYRKGYACQCAYTAWAACDCHRYELALTLLAREMELQGSYYAFGPLYKAAALAATGDGQGAIACLAGYEWHVIRDGRALQFIKEHREFDDLRSTEAFQAVLARWQ